MRVNGTNHWIHTYSAGDIVLQSRGTEAIEEIGILPKYGGTIVHDCWGPYFTYENLEHALSIYFFSAQKTFNRVFSFLVVPVHIRLLLFLLLI